MIEAATKNNMQELKKLIQAKADLDFTSADGLTALVSARRDAPARGKSIARLVDADVRFHVALYRLSGNPWLEEITRPHWVHFRRCMQTVLEDRARRGEVWPEHAEILAAVTAGDPERAGDLAERHARRAGDETAERLSVQSRGLRWSG